MHSKKLDVCQLAKSETEVAWFKQERIENSKMSLELFLDGMITRQKVDTVQAHEAFRQTLLKKIPNAGSKEDMTTSSGIAVMLSSVTRVARYAIRVPA